MHRTEIDNIPGLLVLIDFEKAFDSMSWKFIYNVLEYFGFSKNFIKQIKLFNNNITAYIIQCGKLSDKIYIGRGCRQGDPISAYLFLIAAEILAMLIKSNNNIKGTKIENKEFKISNFADDTTLLLDGSQDSLKAALNSYSGLKVNKEKTKVVWLGRMKFSKDKLKVTVPLDWGNTEFTLLGIHFSVNLNIIPELNYTPAFFKMKNEIKKMAGQKVNTNRKNSPD